MQFKFCGPQWINSCMQLPMPEQACMQLRALVQLRTVYSTHGMHACMHYQLASYVYCVHACLVHIAIYKYCSYNCYWRILAGVIFTQLSLISAAQYNEWSRWFSRTLLWSCWLRIQLPLKYLIERMILIALKDFLLSCIC